MHAVTTSFMLYVTTYVPIMCICLNIGLNMTKPVLGVSNKAKLRPVSSATETSYEIENLLVANLDMIYFPRSE